MTDRGSRPVVPLADGWGVWRWCALRGGGFPTDVALELGVKALAEASEELLDLEERCAAAQADALASVPAATAGEDGVQA